MGNAYLQYVPLFQGGAQNLLLNLETDIGAGINKEISGLPIIAGNVNAFFSKSTQQQYNSAG